MKPIIERLLDELEGQKKILETSRRIYTPPRERAERVKFFSEAIAEIKDLAESGCECTSCGERTGTVCWRCA